MPAVNLISTLPNFTSQDEHTTIVGSTPNSFTDIPPVIRHKEENVSVVLEPELEGFSNTVGTLYVLTRSVAFYFNLKCFLYNSFFSFLWVAYLPSCQRLALGFRSNIQQSLCMQCREVNQDHPYTVNSTKVLGK